MTPQDAQVITQALVIVAIIVTFAVQQVTLAQAHRDAENRDAEATAERQRIAVEAQAAILVAAATVEEKATARAAELAHTMRLEAQILALQTERGQVAVVNTAAAQHRETLVSLEQTHASAKEAATVAKAAYTEANSVNNKIVTTNEAIVGLQGQIKEVISGLPAALSDATTAAVPQMGSAANPMEMRIVNTIGDPANVHDVGKETNC